MKKREISKLFHDVLCSFTETVWLLQESTIGAAFLTQTVAVNDAVVKFEIWDTAGQERYHSLAPMYYRGAAAAIIVYDITSPVRSCLLTFETLNNPR